MKRCTLSMAMLAIMLLPMSVVAQDTATLFKALIHLENSLSELDNSLNKTIEDKVSSQQDQISKQQGQLSAQQTQLAAVRKEVRALKQAFQEPAPLTEPMRASPSDNLTARLDGLENSIEKLAESQKTLERMLFKLNAEIQHDSVDSMLPLEDPGNQVAIETLALQVKAVSEALQLYIKEQEAKDRLASGVVTRFEKFTIDGFLRFAGIGLYNFDLDRLKANDNYKDRVAVRSFVNLGAKQGDFKALLSINLAGSQFDDGYFWGSDNASALREWNTSIQYLILDYNGYVNARLGRMPAVIGNGILGHSTQDGIMVSKDIKDFFVASYWYKGDADLRNVTDSFNTIVNSDSTGSARDLDVLVVPVGWKFDNNGQVEFVFVRQFDSRADEGFPEKMYFDLNAHASFEKISYKAELAVLRGQTPFNPFFARRLDYQAYMFYLSTFYQSSKFGIGWNLGYGSGDRDPNDGVEKNFQSLFMDENGLQYTFLFSDDLHGFNPNKRNLARASGFGNVTYFQVTGAIYPSSRLKFKGSATLLRASEARDLGTGIFGTNLSENLTRNIGYEVNLNAQFALTEYSSFFVASAVFIPGNIFPSQDLAFKFASGIALRF